MYLDLDWIMDYAGLLSVRLFIVIYSPSLYIGDRVQAMVKSATYKVKDLLQNSTGIASDFCRRSAMEKLVV